MKHPEAPVSDGARVFLFSEENTGSGGQPLKFCYRDCSFRRKKKFKKIMSGIRGKIKNKSARYEVYIKKIPIF